MKTKNIVSLVAIIGVIMAILLAGCIEEETQKIQIEEGAGIYIMEHADYFRLWTIKDGTGTYTKIDITGIKETLDFKVTQGSEILKAGEKEIYLEIHTEPKYRIYPFSGFAPKLHFVHEGEWVSTGRIDYWDEPGRFIIFVLGEITKWGSFEEISFSGPIDITKTDYSMLQETKKGLTPTVYIIDGISLALSFQKDSKYRSEMTVMIYDTKNKKIVNQGSTDAPYGVVSMSTPY